MEVAVHGIERDQHNGGKAYNWGPQPLHHRRGERLRLVNVGANLAIERYERYGYPVCRVCGQSREYIFLARLDLRLRRWLLPHLVRTILPDPVVMNLFAVAL